MTSPLDGERDAGPQAGEHEAGPQAGQQDAGAAAVSGEKSHTVMGITRIASWKQSVSRAKQAGRRKRLGRRLNHEPPWWVSQIVIPLFVGLFISVSIFVAQGRADEARNQHDHEIADQQAARDREVAAHDARHALQLDNLRFLRDRVANESTERFPFTGFDLSGQDLSFLWLSGARLDHADLTQSELRYANLTNGRLNQSNLTSADVEGSNLVGATAPDADFSSAILDEADLSGAYLYNARLVYAFLNAAKLCDALLISVNAAHATFDEAKMNRANFSQTGKWGDLQFDQRDPANLTGASFSNADLSAANFSGANLSGANFGGANLSGTDLSGANLTGAHLDRIYYDSSTKWPKGFRPPPSQPGWLAPDLSYLKGGPPSCEPKHPS